MNSDGWLDIPERFYPYHRYDSLAVIMNDGSGRFGVAQYIDLYMGTTNANIAANDFDEDGDIDYVLAGAGSNERRQYLVNDGTGHFKDSGFQFSRDEGVGVACGDIDGDGDLDLVHSGALFINIWESKGKIRAAINDGFGHFEEDSTVHILPEMVRQVELVDMDLDGDLDIIGTYDAAKLFLMLNTKQSNVGQNLRAIVQSNFSLYQNYPNPFNTQTVIPFILVQTYEDVELAIYDLNGKEVITMVQKVKESESHQFIWDGVDAHGAKVPSGVYFYRLRAGPFSEVRKMTVLR